MTAMDEVRAGVVRNEGKLLDAATHLPVTSILALIPEEPWLALQGPLQEELTAEVLDAGRRVKLPTLQKAAITFRFDAERPEAAAWAAKEAGALIVEIVEEQRTAVRDYTARASLGEFTPRQVARNLRDVIGLTNAQQGWVENFRARAIGDALDRGLSLDAAVNAADAPTEKYQKRIHRYRSETIARTEILRASSEGRREAWSQGMAEGFIDPRAQKEWSAEIDGRNCEICAALDGVRVGITDQFPAGDPPRHPNCRCDVLLVDEIPQDIRDMSDDELEAEIMSLLSGEQTPPPVTTVEPDRVVVPGIPKDTKPGDIGGKRVTEAQLRDKYAGFTPTKAQIDAVEGYQTREFYPINSGLRQGNLDPKYADTVRELDGLFEQAPGVGVQTGEYFRTTEASVLAGLKRGDTFIDDGYTSTSISSAQALEFAEQSYYDAKVRILDVANSPKIWVDGISEMGIGASQGEIIFQRGTPYTYLGKDRNGWHVLATAKYRA
jgi:SPP1 gp7 family putative phage head morphogenesis protein